MKTYAQLLASRIGFAAAFTGGAEPYIVTHLGDNGPGSLREAAALGGRFITAADGLVGELLLPTEIPVVADTLIALGPNIQLKHVGLPHHGLRLYGSNIGVMYTVLDGGAAAGTHDNGSDGIRVEKEASDLIYIARNLIYGWLDGAIDTETHGPIYTDRMSIVWNSIKSTVLAVNLWANRVSFGFNRVADVSGRGPKITGGKLHAYNNLTKRWGGSNIRQTGGGGTLCSDYDMWIVGDGGTKIGTADGPMFHYNRKHFGTTAPTFVGENGSIDPAFAAAARACSGMDTSMDWSVIRALVEAAGPNTW